MTPFSLTVPIGTVKEDSVNMVSSPAPRPRGVATRRRLLAAAMDLVCERGAAGTSVGAVCERAGAAKTALYWHFGNKEGIIYALLDGIATMVSSDLATLVAGPLAERRPADEIVDVLKRFVCTRKQQLQVLQVLVNERANLSKKICERLRGLNLENARLLARSFSTSAGRQDPNFELLAFSAIALMLGSLWMHQLDPEHVDVERMVDHVRDLVSTYMHRERGQS